MSIDLPPSPAASGHDSAARPRKLLTRRLPPLYYLHNFRGAMQSLEQRYATLMSDAERAFIRTFAGLAEPSQCLLTRMLMRKGPTFKRATLRYPEIPQPHVALEQLAEHGWVETDPVLSALELQRMLGPTQRREVSGSGGRRPAAARDAMQFLLPIATEPATPRPLSQWHQRLAATHVHLAIEPLARRLQFLYFGNDWQTWAEFVLTDLGLQRYEEVPYDAASCAFTCRAEIEHFYRLNECIARSRHGEPAASIVPDAWRPEGVSEWLAARFARLHLELGELLQRQGQNELALQTWRNCPMAAARIRLVRLQERLGMVASARNEAEAALRLAAGETERRAMATALKRLRRRLGEQPAQDAPRSRPAVIRLSLPEAPDQRIERRVCAALSSGDCQAFYVENSLFPALFALLCWDAIFAPLPGAFFHPFQSGPADLFTPEFRVRRAALLDAQLALLDADAHRDVIWRNYHAKTGISSRLVRWGRLRPQVLSLALACIPPAHLKLIFAEMLEDLEHHRTGLPDLVLFRRDQPSYQLLEVKAPGDRLQDNQRRWMEFFARQGIPAAVCTVTWTVQNPAPLADQRDQDDQWQRYTQQEQ
ncbi:MAG: VRR-NUC domain-containing protein [Steroidobacteraceae bacterium]